MALLPLLVWLLERAMAKRRVCDFLFFSLGYALLILTVHLQVVYFASWLLGAIFLFRLIRGIVIKQYSVKKSIVYLLLFVMAIVLGLGITTFQIYPPYKYLGNYSVRTAITEQHGIQFSNSWRLNLEGLVSTVFPDFVGIDLGKRQTYWGRNVFRLNSMYLGLLSVILAIAALFALKKPILKFLAGYSLFAITYSLGTQTPLFYIYYYLIPQVKKFRGPEMLFFFVPFAVVIGMAFAIDYAIKYASEDHNEQKHIKSKGKIPKKKSKNPALFRWILWTALGSTAVLLILSIIGKPLGMWWLKTAPNFQNVNIQSKMAALNRNFPIFLRSAWIAMFLSWAAAGILLWRMKTKKLATAAVVSILAIIVIVDLWRIDKPFVVPVDMNEYFPKPPVVDYLKEQWDGRGPFRTLCLPQTMSYTHLASFGLDAVTFSELHGNQLRWYDEFTGRHQQPQNIQKYFNFWDILNIEYVLSPQQLNMDNLVFIGRYGNFWLYRNPFAFPRARSFHKWETTSHDAALQKLKSPFFIQDSISNYRNTLLIEGKPDISIPAYDSTSVRYAVGKVVDNRDDDFYVEIDMPRDGFLFVSQNWYPEWSAEENDKQLPIFRADYSFIAVPLERGSHKVHFYYKASLVKKSLKVSLFSFIFLLLVLISSEVLRTSQVKQKEFA